jgi:hypothetical protein
MVAVFQITEGLIEVVFPTTEGSAEFYKSLSRQFLLCAQKDRKNVACLIIAVFPTREGSAKFLQ